MQITFDPFNQVEKSFVESLLGALTPGDDAATLHGSPRAQPVVADNDGIDEDGSSTGPGLVDDTGGRAEPPSAPSGDTPKKRGRKPKAAEVMVSEKSVGKNAVFEEVFAEQPPRPEPAPAADVLPTLDQVRDALQQYTVKNGITGGVELLKEFGAARVSELAAGDFASFIARCAA